MDRCSRVQNHETNHSSFVSATFIQFFMWRLHLIAPTFKALGEILVKQLLQFVTSHFARKYQKNLQFLSEPCCSNRNGLQGIIN